MGGGGGGGGGQKDRLHAENGGGGGGAKKITQMPKIGGGGGGAKSRRIPTDSHRAKDRLHAENWGLQIGTQQDLNKMVDMVKFLGQKDRPDAENGGKTAAQTYRLSKRECPHPVNIPVSIRTRSGTVQRW